MPPELEGIIEPVQEFVHQQLQQQQTVSSSVGGSGRGGSDSSCTGVFVRSSLTRSCVN